MLVWHGTELKLLARPPNPVSVRVYICKHCHSLSEKLDGDFQAGPLGHSILPLPAPSSHSFTCHSRLCKSHLVFWGSNNEDSSKSVDLFYWLVIPFYWWFQPVPGPLGVIVRRAEIFLHLYFLNQQMLKVISNFLQESLNSPGWHHCLGTFSGLNSSSQIISFPD